MLTSNPTEIIGKILIAQNPVKVYRDGATSVNDYFSIVSVGNEVGKVSSFIGGSNGIPIIYKFLDSNNTAYYAFDNIGAFIIKKASTKQYLIIVAIAIGAFLIFRKSKKSRN